MAARIYRFHCTDGRELVMDLTGTKLPTLTAMRVDAEQVALGLMARVAERFDWSGWRVDVYDPKDRRVWVTAFIDIDAELQAA